MNFDVGIIGVIVVLVAILAFLYFRKFRDEKGKEELKKFIDSIQGNLEHIILDHIEFIDITSMENIAIVEEQIINDFVNMLWDETMRELDEYVTDAFTKTLIKKFLTREYIEDLTLKLFKKANVQKVYTSKYNEVIVNANREAILLEAKMEKYNNEIEKNSPVDLREIEDIDPNSIIDESGKVVEKEIIPPHEEEPEEVNVDEAIDIIE